MPLGVISGILTSLGVPEDDILVSFTYVDIPEDKKKPVGQFPKGLNFNIQVNQFQNNQDWLGKKGDRGLVEMQSLYDIFIQQFIYEQYMRYFE